MEWYFILLIVLGGLFIIFLILGLVIHKLVYGRCQLTDGQIDGWIKGSYLKPYYNQIKEGMSWIDNAQKEEVTIESYDKLKLVGYLIKNKNSNNKVMICVHGYHSVGKFDFSCGVKDYYDLGFDLLIIDQRAHGKSEGRYTTFGIKERFDLQKWIEYIDNRYNHNVQILAGGVSMGSSTVMYTLNLDLPETFKGAICDCGYTCPIDVLRVGMKKMNKYIPKYFLSFFVNLASIITTGKSLSSISTKDTLPYAKVPVLIIHGDIDRTVPIKMGYTNYELIKSEKYIKVIKNAEHGASYLVDTENVSKMIKDFTNKYFK